MMDLSLDGCLDFGYCKHELFVLPGTKGLDGKKKKNTFEVAAAEPARTADSSSTDQPQLDHLTPDQLQLLSSSQETR